MIEPLPIPSPTDPLIIKGKRYFVMKTGINDDGQCVDTLKSESTGLQKTFTRSAILRSIDKKVEKK